MTEDTQVMTRAYSTRGMHKKLLSDTIEASKSKAAKKKKLRSTTMLDDKVVHDDQVVDMKDEKDDSETESNKGLLSLKLHAEIPSLRLRDLTTRRTLRL